MKELIPDDPHLHNWLDMARQRIHFQGLPARICWVGLGQRDKLGVAFNDMVKSGELKAPVVIGRDHLDSGSVASPNRETEAMQDGSDAVSDWPLLNALLNTASGATWVSIHHGGGVGIGYSQHAGMVIVCDGSEAAGRRLSRVLWNDPATGVMRHADAGYDIALECARQHQLRLPGILGKLTCFETTKQGRRVMNKRTLLGLAAACGLSFALAGTAYADQLADIKAKGKIVAATEMHFAPFDMLVDGKYEGICHDLFTEVAKELGVEVEFLDLPWSSVLPGLEAGKFDIVNAPVTITAERAARYRFTLPMGNATVALLKKAGDDTHQQARRHRRQGGRIAEGLGPARTAQGLRRHPAQAGRRSRICQRR